VLHFVREKQVNGEIGKSEQTAETVYPSCEKVSVFKSFRPLCAQNQSNLGAMPKGAE
jgi:hypothetical protein